MKDVKELFDKAENGTLTYEQFTALAKEANAKLVDLNEGGYVSKNKYDSDVEAKAKEIETLNGTISTRDADLETLKKQLEDAGTDATKLTELTSQFETLKGKYDADTKSYKDQLKKQAYEFAVKEFASSKNFTSQAAKRDFERSMIAKELKMENNLILGAEDFVKAYTETNADAFVVDQPAPETPGKPKPQFIGSTQGAQDMHNTDSTNGFANAFHFTPLRPLPEK